MQRQEGWCTSPDMVSWALKRSRGTPQSQDSHTPSHRQRPSTRATSWPWTGCGAGSVRLGEGRERRTWAAPGTAGAPRRGSCGGAQRKAKRKYWVSPVVRSCTCARPHALRRHRRGQGATSPQQRVAREDTKQKARADVTAGGNELLRHKEAVT